MGRRGGLTENSHEDWFEVLFWRCGLTIGSCFRRALAGLGVRSRKKTNRCSVLIRRAPASTHTLTHLHTYTLTPTHSHTLTHRQTHKHTHTHTHTLDLVKWKLGLVKAQFFHVMPTGYLQHINFTPQHHHCWIALLHCLGCIGQSINMSS